MKAKFSILPSEINYSTENMAMLASSILISVLSKENADYIKIKTEDCNYISRREK